MTLEEQLFDEIRRGDDAEAVESLLKKGARLDVGAEHGWTPLFLAIQDERVAIVRAILGHGVDARSIDSGGETALMAACYRGNLPIVRLLIEHGAEVNTHGPEGDIPVKHAAREGHVEIVRALLDAGADPNVEGAQDGMSALGAAVFAGDPQIVRLLIERGARVNEVDLGHESPLSVGLAEQQREPSANRALAIDVLRQAGALTTSEYYSQVNGPDAREPQ